MALFLKTFYEKNLTFSIVIPVSFNVFFSLKWFYLATFFILQP